MREPPVVLTRRALLAAGAGTLLTGFAGCTASDSPSESTRSPTSTPTATAQPTATAMTEGGETTTPTSISTASAASWRQTELTDVTTGETFTIEQLTERPVLLEFFAVWCPVCTEQQAVLSEVTNRVDELAVVSLNTDPNEDADRVRSHLDQHDGFDWRYAISPSSMTRSLIDQFGSIIANPPAAPIVRVCPSGSASLLEGRGVKSADTLVSVVDQC